MIENQNKEFKTIWKDDYLKWVCGMANADGGIIYIGIDDKGKAVGINNITKLVKEIPNKIKDTMGIVPEVKIKNENSIPYIVIKVEKYPVPISYQGKIYMRSGSNNHEVNGAELDRIMLRKLGKTWDSIPVPNVSVSDLDKTSINKFKKLAVKNKRLTQRDIEVDDETLLKNLGLYDGDYLTIAAILLFHENPEKWVTGAYVKIGYFENNDSDLRYQDEIHGSLINQAENIIELVYLKYLKALIRYEDLKRIEEYMFPKEAFREIIYNSLQHKLYNSCIPIQISVYEDKMYIWNNGLFPTEITPENLYEKHFSQPANPKIAQTFFKAGFTESWGRGFEKIKDECIKNNNSIPQVKISENGVMIKCEPSTIYMKLLKQMKKENVQGNVQENVQENLKQIEIKILELIKNNPGLTQIQLSKILKVNSKTIYRGIQNLKNQNIIERIGSDRKGYWKMK